MKITKEMENALNKQINAEMYSGYLYMAMAAHFESVNLEGFANWMKQQAKEEMAHAMKFWDYVYDRGGSVQLDTIDKPKLEWKTPLEAFQDAYDHEKKVTEMINGLLEHARKIKDYATESMLKWFVDEQVEEEASAENILEKLKLIKDSVNGLMMLDAHLKGRGQG